MIGEGLLVFETHPVQYRAPMYRLLQQQSGIPVTVVYGSDFSVAGYRDKGFGRRFAWDVDLLSGYQSIFLSRVSERGTAKATVRGLSEVLRRQAPAAVLVVGYSPFYHQTAFFHSWRAGYPILLRGEVLDSPLRGDPVRSWVRDLLLRPLYARCSKILYIGQRSYQHYRRLGVGEAELVFSPYSVDAAAFQCEESDRARLRGEARQALGIAEDKNVLLFSGKLVRHKGVELLLRAVRNLPAEVRERIEILWIGSGKLEAALALQSQNPPLVKGHFPGFQNQSQMSRYYHAADLLVLPSWRETWGLVVNEALHHGLPAIVSEAVGCAPDLVKLGCTGEIFKTGSAKELAAAIQRGLILAGRSEIRERCRDQVRGYSVGKAAEGIARAYRSVVTGPR